MTDLRSETKQPFMLQMWVWWRADRYCGQCERLRKRSSGFNELLSKHQDFWTCLNGVSLTVTQTQSHLHLQWREVHLRPEAIAGQTGYLCVLSNFSITSPHSQLCTSTHSDFKVFGPNLLLFCIVLTIIRPLMRLHQVEHWTFTLASLLSSLLRINWSTPVYF